MVWLGAEVFLRGGIPVDPKRMEAAAVCAADIPAVSRHETDLTGIDLQGVDR
jgi:hypothetical protein